MFVGTFKVHFESALSKSRITCRPHRNFCHSIHLHPFHHIHVGVVDLVFGLHLDFDFGTVHWRESRSEAQVVSIDTHTYAINAWMYRLQKPREAQVVSIDTHTYALNAWMYRLQKPHNKKNVTLNFCLADQFFKRLFDIVVTCHPAAVEGHLIM